MAAFRFQLILFLVALSSFGMCARIDFSPCPALWTLSDDNCYRYFAEPKNLAEARTTCQMFSNGGEFANLVSIHSERENDFVSIFFKTSIDSSSETSTDAGKQLYIGLIYDAAPGSGVHKWSDRSTPMSVLPWKSSEPQTSAVGNGAVLVHPGDTEFPKWASADPSVSRRFMCKVPAISSCGP